jgi:hypothetical protein
MIPSHIFLDTSVVNFILDYGEQIHDGIPIPEHATFRVVRDIEALRGIWLTGQRASWHITISAGTIAEIKRTGQLGRLQDLLSWASELVAYSDECERLAPTTSRRIQSAHLEKLCLLPDSGDRQLLREALQLGWDAFCTRDWKTILRHRDELPDLPLSILSPHEWWTAILPYAPLFA